MKTLVALLAFVFSVCAYAEDSCLDLNGVYRIDDVRAVRITQFACKTLKISNGEIQDVGRIDWYKANVSTTLDGAPTCDKASCVTGKIYPDEIEISRDQAWTTTNEHGSCEYRQESLLLDAGRNLIRKQTIYNCQDGFSGMFETVLLRMN